MKKIAAVISAAVCLAVLAACGAPPPENTVPPSPTATPSAPVVSESPTGAPGSATPGPGESVPPSPSGSPGTEGGPLMQALMKDDLAADRELVGLFLDYYTEHHFELRFLPQFRDAASLSRDDLSFYVFNMAIENTTDYRGYVTKEEFETTLRRYLGDIEYEHGDSEYMTFDGEKYVPVGWDYMGAEFFRLTRISRAGDTFTASFDIVSFYELDFMDSYEDVSPNMRAVMDELGIMEMPENPRTAIKAIKAMLLRDDYDEVFTNGGRITVTFRLVRGQDNLFIYTSCEREYPPEYGEP